jgi:uncharacterized protein YndB with AHSA1/START domain
MSEPGAVTTLVVRRRIAATREDLFDAWTDPASMRAWMCPGSVASAEVEMDLRVGGRLRILMQDSAATYEYHGVFTVIDRPAVLAFTWIAKATDMHTTLVTVEFIERGELDTELVLTHEPWPRPEGRDQYRAGWTSILEKLAAFLRVRG